MDNMEEKSTGLEKEIFGSDSELSSEGEGHERAHKRRMSPIPATRDATSGSEDHYTSEPGSKSKKGKARSDVESSKVPRKRKKRRPTSQEVEEPTVELSPEEQRRLQLSQTIDAIVKPNKSRPKKRKKQEAEEILDRFADEEVVRLRDEMNMAAEADFQANLEKRPATAKLRMLPEVMDVLQKQGLQQSIFDNNLLSGVRKWLEPLPDKSLPALNIQNSFFEALAKMDIDTNTLKEAGLGKIVLFYTRCKRVTPPIKRAAEYLVDIWSRPIIKRSSSYRDRQIPVAMDAPNQPTKVKLGEILARAQEADRGRVRKNAVRIPERELATYTVAPRSDMPGASGPAGRQAQVEIEKRRANQDRLRKMQRKLALHKARNSRL